MGRVEDKVALVTGGALGLGRASAELLAREGAKVVVTDLMDAEGGRLSRALGWRAARRPSSTMTWRWRPTGTGPSPRR